VTRQNHTEVILSEASEASEAKDLLSGETAGSTSLTMTQ